jgi:hypothetical protein
VKRRELLRRLRDIAKAEGVELVMSEGGKHTQVRIGDRVSYVPRHSEVNELTARSIIRHMAGEEG